jgi:exopolyphosphatase/guanosine-5'-triphosphate,3'-diphosphate pyrophosphatase
MPAAPTFESVAAVDLGSNSFHMVVAQLSHGQLQVIDRLRDRVALAEGLGEDRKLSGEAVERALACLARFGQRLRGMPSGAVRAVGTNTLRRARNARAFLAAAEEALGFPIEVIPGLEEARLIYLGVTHSRADESRRRLVVDIGGGSTEIILGEGADTIGADSLHMGCVSWSRRFFGLGALTRDAMRQARIAAGQELQGIVRRYRALGWQAAVGSSGTIVATEEILRLNDWSEGGVTPKGVRKLRKALIAADRVDKLQLAGLQSDRAPVIAGGVAILSAVVEALEIERVDTSPGALREGLLVDLLGRIRHEDTRDRTIRRVARAWDVDLEQAARVERTALELLEQVAPAWELGAPEPSRLLGWAARLHELGLTIAHSGYHKHGAYVAANADLPGFSREDQEMLSLLILSHRRKFPREPNGLLPEARATQVRRLAALLRVAVLLNRGRGRPPVPDVEACVEGDGLRLTFPEGWLEHHPLTQADLEQERSWLKSAGIPLAFA